MVEQCENIICKGALNFLVHNDNILIGVCGNHLAWAVRQCGGPGEPSTVTNVSGVNINEYRSRRIPSQDLDSDAKVG